MKCTAHLKAKIKCVAITMCSLVTSPFSCDFIKIKVSAMFIVLTYLPCVQYSHSAWFLDGRTSTLVSIVMLFQSINADFSEQLL